MITSGLPGSINNIFLFLDAESLIRYGGLFLVFLVVYSSTGLFFCFFLPSGAVLFAAGVFAATGGLKYDIFTVCSLLTVAAFFGSITGYGFGWRVGPLLYKRKDSWFFRRQHLTAAETFYKKYGGLALAAGYFLPIIRTFSPVVAGMIRLNFRRFLLFTLTGSVSWVISFVLAGYFIGSRPFLKPWLKYFVTIFILVVTVPLLFRIIKELRGTERK